jgi:hypothetical protein
MNEPAPMKKKLLTKPQRTMLAQIAARAWRRLRDAHAVDESFDAWRLRKSKRACGHRLSEAPIDAFDDLFICFKAEAGDTDEAYERAASKVSNAVRSDLINIRAALSSAGLREGYAVSIARTQWEDKLGLVLERLEQLPACATRTLLYTIRARARAMIKQHNQGL